VARSSDSLISGGSPPAHLCDLFRAREGSGPSQWLPFLRFAKKKKVLKVRHHADCLEFLKVPFLTGQIPNSIGNCFKLEKLIFSKTQHPRALLTGPIPVSLGNRIDLQRLNLLGNQLTGEFSTRRALLPRKVTFCF
jgi:hypothetical protein